MVRFHDVDGFEANDYGVETSSVLKATKCEGGCGGGFCVDEGGYLVSVKPISITPFPSPSLSHSL